MHNTIIAYKVSSVTQVCSEAFYILELAQLVEFNVRVRQGK